MYQIFEIRFLSSFTADLVIIFGEKVRQVYKTERNFLSCSAQCLMRRDRSGTPSLSLENFNCCRSHKKEVFSLSVNGYIAYVTAAIALNAKHLNQMASLSVFVKMVTKGRLLYDNQT